MSIEWAVLDDGDGALGRGAGHAYLVSGQAAEGRVLVSRWKTGAADACWQVLRNVVTLPMGRGPGRPPGEPEMIFALAQARHFCERWEEGWSPLTAPAWSDAGVDAEAEAERRPFGSVSGGNSIAVGSGHDPDAQVWEYLDGLPLSDDDSEAEADAAEQRAQFARLDELLDELAGDAAADPAGRYIAAPFETGEPWRPAAERDWDDSRD